MNFDIAYVSSNYTFVKYLCICCAMFNDRGIWSCGGVTCECVDGQVRELGFLHLM